MPAGAQSRAVCYGAAQEAATSRPMTASSCTVVAPTRLHVGLIDCSDATPRRFGGVGIALAEPDVRLRVTGGASRHSEVVGLCEDEDLAQAVLAAVIAVTREDPAVFVEFERLPPRHVGLGTGTASRLAAAAGAAHIAGVDIPVGELALLCGRGGTSGIGVNAFATGGVIFDGGHVVEKDEPFAPSRYQIPSRVPPVVTRLTLPPQWEISLLCPWGEIMTGKDELRFFQHELPIPALESLQTLGYLYHGVAPAVLEGDFGGLASALRQIHSVGFKKRELARQSDEVRKLLSQLHATETVAAGMSSLGPLIYAITERYNSAANRRVLASAAAAGVAVLPARPADSGYRIESQSHEEV